MSEQSDIAGSARVPALTPDQHELSRLLKDARVDGKPDARLGKRAWLRYRWGIRLEVAVGPIDSNAHLQVAMHDISEGGCGFWSREKIPLETEVSIREWSPDGPGRWLPAVVTHCSVGFSGHRIGVQFRNPLRPGSRHAGRSDSEGFSDADSAPAVASGPPRTSLRARCLAASVTLSALVAIAVGVSCPHIRSGVSPLVAGGAAFLLSLGLAGSLMWISLGGHFGYLRALRNQMEALAGADLRASRPPPPPSRELWRIQGALSRLRLTWQGQKDQEARNLQRLEDINLLKTNILNTVSHDLRTPLTSILLYARMLEEDLTTLAEGNTSAGCNTSS